MTHPASPSPATGAVLAALDLIAALTALAREENAILGRGMPAALSGLVDRKTELAARFQIAQADLGRQGAALVDVDPQLVARLFQETAGLRAILSENVVRLEAARDASRRRIDLVMEAIRCELAQPKGYGASGRTVYAAVTPPAFARIDA